MPIERAIARGVDEACGAQLLPVRVGSAGFARGNNGVGVTHLSGVFKSEQIDRLNRARDLRLLFDFFDRQNGCNYGSFAVQY